MYKDNTRLIFWEDKSVLTECEFVGSFVIFFIYSEVQRFSRIL